MDMRRFLLISGELVFLLLVMVALNGCQRQAGEPRTIRIELQEFSFKPQTVRLPVGQEVQIELINKGKVEHEMMIGRGGVHQMEGMPHGYMEDFFEHGKVPVEVGGEKFKVGSPEEIEEAGWHVEVEPGG